LKSSPVSYRDLKKEIPIREVYLFGSYAVGDPKEHSDIDIAVISDWFEGKTKIENMQYLSRIAASYNNLVGGDPSFHGNGIPKSR